MRNENMFSNEYSEFNQTNTVNFELSNKQKEDLTTQDEFNMSKPHNYNDNLEHNSPIRHL